MDPDTSPSPTDQPPVFNYVLSFLLVGVAWGFTTPFIRRAAADFNARQDLHQQSQATSSTSRSQDQAQSQSQHEGEGAELQPRSRHHSEEAHSAREGETQPLREGRGSDSDSEDEDEDTDHPPPSARPAWMRNAEQSQNKETNGNWIKTKLHSVFWTVVNLLRTPAYAIPLVINLTGSVWFFLLVGKHELSLTVPLANSSAFLFTVLGEWYVERKVIEKETWLGMAMVLGGIAICVKSKGS